ncbi:MAG TPA: hypothetical protein VNO55_19820 [Polyangia bacterium]|nr:hypothetical protein [Polyangia bacterium]
MTGYHATREQCLAFIAACKGGSDYLTAKPYKDRHGMYPDTDDHGVWHEEASYWVFMTERE